MPLSNYSFAVRQFAKAFGHPLDKAEVPRDLDEMKAGLIKEEVNEFLEALEILRSGLELQSIGRAPEELHIQERRADVLKELCDILYVVFGYAEMRGWPIEAAFNRVHNSNMSKLDEDGKPIYREDGKVMKGPLYRPPNLMDLV